ncbi:PASTA domain-containing protein [Desulfosarcina cetonica]|uniref:PASTA domain-containing protein n=1 Tax=Desulfosarcina cetonica TaxID=90730 RepID=UPI0012EEC250
MSAARPAGTPQTAIEIVRAVNGRRVPNLGGQTQRGAQAILNQYGLSWGGASTRPSDARASWNRVIDQSPRTGTWYAEAHRFPLLPARCLPAGSPTSWE